MANSASRVFRSARAIVTLLAAPCVVGAYDFDSDSDYVAPATMWQSWHQTVMQIKEDSDVISACMADEQTCGRGLKGVRVVLTRGSKLEPYRQLSLINQYINRFNRYRRDRPRDIDNDGEVLISRQQWSSLLEFLDRGGDCEDYATAKYALLRELGYSDDTLRIVVVYDIKLRAYHAIVAVKLPNGKSYLLDIDNRIYRTRPHEYRYIYALNANSIWDHGIDLRNADRRIKRHTRSRRNE